MGSIEQLPSNVWKKVMCYLGLYAASRCCVLNRKIHWETQWVLAIHPRRREPTTIIDFTGASCPYVRAVLYDHKTMKFIK